jgi:hypothetical protein
MKIKNCLNIIILTVCSMLAFVSCSADEPADKPVDVKGVIWQDKGVYFGVETNRLKAGLWVRYSTNATDETLVQIMPVIYNDGISNDITIPEIQPVTIVGGAFLWLPPEASRYQMELYSSNGIAVPKTSKGKMFGRKMDLHPKPVLIGGAGRNFKEPGYYGNVYQMNATNQITPYDPTVGYVHPETFVLQDLFKITEPGKYHLAFEIRGLMRKFSKYQNLIPYYLPVNVEIEIKKP